MRVGRLHLAHLAHLAEIARCVACCLWPSPAPSQRARAARAAAGEFRVSVGVPPTRGSPLAARLLSPGIYIWRPPRLRPIPSLTVPDLHTASLAVMKANGSDLGLYRCLLFAERRAMCGMPTGDHALRDAIARCVLQPSLLQ